VLFIIIFAHFGVIYDSNYLLKLLIIYLGGKSAILTGITVCLGGKANVTNRASNLKSLIREGSK